MTPKMDRQTRQALEMARGREVLARAGRQETLQRWIKAKKIDLFYDATWATPNAKAVSMGGFRIYVGNTMVLQGADDKDFPTEAQIAQVGLAIRALADFDGVALADPPPRAKSASALHVAETQRRLNEAAMNWQMANGKN